MPEMIEAYTVKPAYLRDRGTSVARLEPEPKSERVVYIDALYDSSDAVQCAWDSIPDLIDSSPELNDEPARVRGTNISVETLRELFESEGKSVLAIRLKLNLTAQQVWAAILYERWARVDQEWWWAPAWQAAEQEAEAETHQDAAPPPDDAQ